MEKKNQNVGCKSHKCIRSRNFTENIRYITKSYLLSKEPF